MSLVVPKHHSSSVTVFFSNGHHFISTSDLFSDILCKLQCFSMSFLWKAFKQPTTDSTAEANDGNRHVNLTNVKSRWDVEHKDWMVGDEEKRAQFD